MTTMMLLRQRGGDTEYYYGEGDVSLGFMGDNGSVKSDYGDKGSGAVPSSRESSFMRDLRRAATSPLTYPLNG